MLRHKLPRNSKLKIHLPKCWIDIHPIQSASYRIGTQYQVTHIPNTEDGPYLDVNNDVLISSEELETQNNIIWSEVEKDNFDSGMLNHYKDFTSIQSLVQTKSLSQIIEYYYLWKYSKRYKAFKRKMKKPYFDVIIDGRLDWQKIRPSNLHLVTSSSTKQIFKSTSSTFQTTQTLSPFQQPQLPQIEKQPILQKPQAEGSITLEFDELDYDMDFLFLLADSESEKESTEDEDYMAKPSYKRHKTNNCNNL